MFIRLVFIVGVTALLVVGAAGSSSAQSTPMVDYDLDDDNLIEVRTRAQYLAIHHDMDGDGNVYDAQGNEVTVNSGGFNTGVTWTGAFPNAMPNAGCPLRDHDDDPQTPNERKCIGYELLADIDFNSRTFVPLGKTGQTTQNQYHVTMIGNGFRIMNPGRVGGVGGRNFGIISILGFGSLVEGIGVINPGFDAGQGGHGGIAGDLKGTLRGSYVEGGTVHGGGNTGGLVGSIDNRAADTSPNRYWPNFSGKIFHSYVDGTHVEDAINTGGLIGSWGADGGTTPDTIGMCVNSYFSGTVTVNFPNLAHGLIAGSKSGGTITNCVADSTTDTDDSHVWDGANSNQNTAHTATKAAMVAVTDYNTPATGNPFANFGDYNAAGTAIAAGLPRADHWDFGDKSTLPRLKYWGHDRSAARARPQSGTDTVNLCERTLAVANEIIRHLNDDNVLSGVSPTPTALSLTPCTSAADTREVSITNLTNLVVTSATNPINLTPNRTLPASEHLTTLDTNDFAYLTSANHFDLSGNAIEYLPPRLFQGVPLRYLDLSHNKLTSLPADLFAGITVPTGFLGNGVILNDNQLTDTGIPARIFDPMTHLQALDLSNNALTRVNTRWFESLVNLGDRPATGALYAHGLGLHLAGNTITEHYYSNKLYSGVRDDVVSYVDVTSPSAKTAGVVLREAIEAAITAAAGGTTPTTLKLTGTDFWFNSGGSTTGYQASTVTSCIGTQTVGPGRFKYLNDTAPACQIQPHYSPPHKSGDTATTALTSFITTSTGRTTNIYVGPHAPSASFVAHQLRFRPSDGDYWTPWQVLPITDTAGTKSGDVYTEFSGLMYQWEIRSLSTTGPPSSVVSRTFNSPAANWLTAFSATAGTGAVGRIALSWTLDSTMVTSNHSVIQFFYRLKPNADTLYGPWTAIPDGADTDSPPSAANETSYVINGLTPAVGYNVQLAAGIDDNDSGSDINYFTDWRSATATPLTIPANLRAAGGTTPGTLSLTWSMQAVATTSSSKFQVRSKLKTARWPTTSGGGWVDVPDSTGPGGDAGTHQHDETGFLLSGLVAGALHDIEVRLHWSDSAGAQTAVAITGTPTQAAAPVSFNATAGTDPGEIDLSWTAQTATSDADAHYELRARVTGTDWPESNGGWQRISGSTHSTASHNFHTTNGSSIDVELRFNWDGPGISSSDTVTTVAVAAPVGLNATPAPGEMLLDWTQQTATTNSEAKYQFRYKLSSASWPTAGAMGWTDLAGTDHETDEGRITSLTPGSALDFQLRFHWSDAVGASAAASVTATPLAIPTVTGLAGATSLWQGSIDLTWNPQTATTATNAGFQVRSRLKQPTLGTWTAWADIPDSTDANSFRHDETAYRLPGLRYRRPYDVEVRMTVGTAKGTATRIEDVTSGYQPRNFQVVPGNEPGTLHLTWDEQTQVTGAGRPNGGFVRFLPACRATSSAAWPAGDWQEMTATDAGGLAQVTRYNIHEYTWSSLTRGAGYDCRIMFNPDPNAHSWPLTDLDVFPRVNNVEAAIVQPPKNVTATASTSTVNAIDLSWDMQTESTVAASHFEYRVKTTAASWGTQTWVDVADSPGDSGTNTYDETGVTVTEITSGTALAANTTYDFQVRFHWNTTHMESASVDAQGTSSAVPSPPNFAATTSATSNGVDLSWDLVSGAASYWYRYRLTTPANSQWTTYTQVADQDSDSAVDDEDEVTVTGLTGGSGYTFNLQARTSSVTNAPAATATATAQRLAPPTAFTATAGTNAGEIDLSWTLPTTGSPIGVEYRYKLASAGAYPSSGTPTGTGSPWRDVPDGSDGDSNRNNETAYTITTTWPGVSYEVQIRAETATDFSLTSPTTTATQTATAVSAPASFTGSVGTNPGTINLSWTAIPTSGLPTSDTVVQYQYRTKLSSAGAGTYTSWTNIPAANTSSYTITGLSSYTQYDIQLRGAIDDNDDADALADYYSSTATATSVVSGIDRPANLRATGGTNPGEVALSWTAQTTFGSTFTNAKYEIRYKLTSENWPSGGGWGDVASSTRTTAAHTLTGLMAAQQYNIELRFEAQSGLTSAGTAVLGTPTAVPTPASFSATTSSIAAGAIDLSWTAQTATSGSEAKYQYRRKLTSAVWPGSSPFGWTDIADSGSDGAHNESSLRVTGLTSGSSYNVELRFHWSDAVGPSSAATATANASNVPIPSTFSASTGSDPGEIDLTWTAVMNATYQVRTKLTSAADSTYTAWSTAITGTTHTVTSLMNAANYTIQIRAVVSGSFSLAATTTAQAQSQPGPQTYTTAAGTNAGEIALSWAAPSSGTVTRYEYRFKLASDATYGGWAQVLDSDTPPDGQADETSDTISSLLGGLSYNVQLRVLTTAGYSLPATATRTATPVAAPTNFTAARGSGPGEIDLTWTALASNTMPTGDSVVQYQYRRRLNNDIWPTAGNLGWTNIPAANTSSYTITGLDPYIHYSIQLRAAIDDGGDADSVADYHSSASSQSGIRSGLPNPSNLRTTGGTTPGSLNLTWTGNTVFTIFPSGVFQYRTKLASAAASAFTTWTSVSTIGPSVTSHTITDLMNGQLHDIQLRYQPTTQLFSSGAAIQATPTALAVPTNVRAVSAPMNVGAIKVSWDAQSAITVSTAEFQVRTKLPSSAWTGIVWTPVPDDTGSLDPDTDRHDETEHIVTGLSADVRYDVQVRFFMSTAIGGSTPVSVSATASSVPVPTGFDATTGSGAGEIDLTWAAITGATGYDYRYKRASASSYPASGQTGDWTSAGTGTSFTVTNLSGGVFYDIQLRAKVTGIGDSAATSAERAQAQTTPGPATLTFSHGTNPGDLKIDWTAPAGGAPVEHYEYRYKLETASDSAYSAWEKVPDDNNDGDFSDETTETISDLQAGKSYHIQFRVYASQAIGYSLPQRGTHASRPVPPPTAFTATGGTNPGEVDLDWTASAGVTILRYEVRHRLGADGAWSGWANSGTTTTHSYTGLRAGMQRTFQVRAVMETVGESASVDVTGTPTPVPTPGSFTASTGTFPGEIDLSWQAVTGATSYQYRYKLRSVATWPDDAEWESVSAALTSTTLETLDEGVTYDIQLRAAMTNVGESTAATDDAAARSATFTDTPTTPAISSAYAVSAAEVPGRIAIKLPGSGETFVYRHRTANPGEWSRWFKITPTASQVQYLVPDLLPGVRYEIQVRAYTGMTTGFTTALESVAQAAPLEAPKGFDAGESSGIILLQWSSPALYTPDSYEYRTRPTGTTTWSAWVTVQHEGDRGSTQRHWVVGLETGISHDFELRMQTQAGPSPIASSAGSARLRIAEVHSIRPVVRSVTVRAGDSIALTVDIYDTQEGIDNSIPGKPGSKLRFRWSEQGPAGGGTFADPANTRRVTYTAPSTPGVYTITAEAQPDGICTSHHLGAAEITTEERAQCTAIFTVRVSAIPAETAPRPDPVNPTGTIPTSMTDNEGTSYAVFTPADGGTFTGTDITVTAPAAAVPDRTVIGIAATVSDIRPDDPIPGATMSVAGSYYDVRALAETGDPPLPSYTLNEPATACLPFPQEFRADLSNVVVVQRQPTGDLSLLSTTIRSVAGEITACGTLSKLPATIGVARLGLVPAAPAPVQPAIADTPDTGAAAPTYTLLLLAFLAGVLLLTRISKIRRIS